MITEAEFIENVVDEITEGGTIMLKPKDDRIKTIIKNTIRKFRQNDDRASEHEYIIIKKELFNTPLFREKRAIQFPGCVIAVKRLRQTGAAYTLGSQNADFMKTNFNYAMAIAGNPGDMLTAVVNSYYRDFLRQFVLQDVSYNFQESTQRLIIEGRDVLTDLVAEAEVVIPDNAFYTIDDFFEYVVGTCKMSMSNVFGFSSKKLIANYDIDVTSIKEDGKRRIDDVKEVWKEQRENVSFLILSH